MTSHTDAVSLGTELDLATAATVPPEEALIVAYLVLVDVAKSLFYRAQRAQRAPSAQPSRHGARPVADQQRSVRRLHRRAAPFTVHTLAGPGRWLLHRGSSSGTPTRAAGRA